MFTKATFKDLKKVKRIKLCIKIQSISVQKLLTSGDKNAHVNRTRRVCHVIYIFTYRSSLGEVGGGGPLCTPPIREHPRKGLSLIALTSSNINPFMTEAVII